MDWVDYILFVVMVLGVFAGAYSFGRHPLAWTEFVQSAIVKFGPGIIGWVLKKEDPDVRKRRQQAERQGQEWDYVNKRPRERNK